MREPVSIFRISFYCACICVFVFVMSTVYRLFGTINYVTYSFDSCLSYELQRDITERVALCKYNDTYNPEAIIHSIKSYFLCAESVFIDRLPCHIAKITVTAHSPLVRINNKYVLTNAKTVVLDYAYDPYILSSLPLIFAHLPHSDISFDTMLCAVKGCIKDRIFERYTLYWFGEHELYLRDIHDPSFSLLCDAVSMPSNTKLAWCEQVKQNVMNRKLGSKQWVADVRFTDQIIVSGDKKRGEYGKNI